MSQPTALFDRALWTARKHRCAPHAAEHEFLLARVADDLAGRLELVRRSFPVAVNLGAYHGLLGRRLRELPSIGLVIDTERAPALLAECSGPRVLADEEALPFATGSLDLVVSALSLQLANDLPGALVQIRHALKPDGLFLGALLGGESLHELRETWLVAEDEVEGGSSPRVAPFADVRELGGLLQRAGFALPVADADTVTVTYPSPLALMAEVKAMGASNMLCARRRQPVRRATLFRAAEIYAARFGRDDGRVPATFEIVTLTAWAPHPDQPKALRPGSATTRLADALGTREHGTGEKPGG
jgi:NADH dehydrogenase [ubiquinone] 1 alpha subcomplex assembly factor 5